MDIYTYMYVVGTVFLFAIVSYLTGYFRPDEERFEICAHGFLLRAWVVTLLTCFAGTILYLTPQAHSEIKYAFTVFVAAFLAGALLMGPLIKLGREAGERAASRTDRWLEELN